VFVSAVDVEGEGDKVRAPDPEIVVAIFSCLPSKSPQQLSGITGFGGITHAANW
jgi:hypothetical protein